MLGACAARREANAAKRADDLTASLKASMAECKASAADLEKSQAAVGQYEVKLARSEEQVRVRRSLVALSCACPRAKVRAETLRGFHPSSCELLHQSSARDAAY